LRQFNVVNELNIAKRDTGEAAGTSNRNELHASSALPSSELQQAIRDDYRSGGVETVQGWILAKTEAELIRLAKPATEKHRQEEAERSSR
jgi:hypothetical protein